MTKRFLLAAAIVCLTNLAPAGARADTGHCTPQSVTVNANLVSVTCTSEGVAAFRTWAVRASDTAYADRFLNALVTAMMSGRKFTIEYSASDTTLSSLGCASATCRPAAAFEVKNASPY